MTPTEWVRIQTRDQISSRLIKEGSIDGAAKYYGVSPSFLKSILGPGFSTIEEKPVTAELVERYGSVRLTARMTGVTEGRVRAFVKANKLEPLLKYDFSNHNNGKGRRAEVYWASLEGEKVTEDCNVTMGSQADYDFVHSDLGKVNVKSSKAYRYTAKTRAKNPYYWKFSAKSLEKADSVALVLYDSKMQSPLHVFNLKVTPDMLRCSSFRGQMVKGKLELIYKLDGGVPE